jgi:hypothetical protein
MFPNPETHDVAEVVLNAHSWRHGKSVDGTILCGGWCAFLRRGAIDCARRGRLATRYNGRNQLRPYPNGKHYSVEVCFLGAKRGICLSQSPSPEPIKQIPRRPSGFVGMTGHILYNKVTRRAKGNARPPSK